MKVKLLLVRPGGTYRRQSGTLTKDFPDHILNHRDNQAYPLIESPVFPVTQPYPLNTFEELVAAPPIPPSLTPEKYMAVVEDGGVWPYSPKLVQTKEGMVIRQRKRMDWQEEGRQYAENESISQGLGNGLLTFGGVAAVVVFSIMALLTALVLAQYKFAPKEEELVPAAAVLTLLGAVASARSMGNVAGAPAPSTSSGQALPAPNPVLSRRARTAQRRLRQRINVYLYDSIDYSIKHYSLPFSVISEHLGLGSVYFPDVGRYRLMAGLLLPALLGLLVFAGMWETRELWDAQGVSGIVLLALAEMVVLPLTFLVGWWKGPALIQALSPTMRPFCVARRGVTGVVEILGEPEEGAEADPSGTQAAVMPIHHTHLTGVDPQLYDGIIDDLLQEAIAEAEEQDLPVLPEYRPIVNRARDVYEDLMARLEREDTRIKNTMDEKLQIGSLVVMAFAATGVLFFVAFATA